MTEQDFSKTPFGLELTDSLCEGLKLSFTPDEYVDAYFNDADKRDKYRLEIRDALLALPRWVLAYRRKMHEPDFFTEFIPRKEREQEMMRNHYRAVRENGGITD